MTAQSLTCPPDAVLRDFGLGKLGAAQAETIGQHLETCAECRTRVAGLSGDTFVGRLKQADRTAKPVKRERTYVPGESLANAANSTDGTTSLGNRPRLPDASTDLSNRGRSLYEVSAPPELENHPDYELFKELGQGGMGTVYLAKNRMMDRPEVLKVISKELLARPGALERFQQEIRSAAKLAHPNIVAAYSVLRPGDLLVFAMEYVKGQDLSQVVKARGALPVANAAFYIHQVANGLQHAHEKGMVHRDIKPNNLMLAVDGKKHVVKILDFGLAKATSEKGSESGLTKSGQMLGTPDYVAPEQTLDAHQADIRADIYSLGCTLYFLLSGGPPFQETSLYAILEAHHKRDPKPLNLVRPEVPVELAAVVARMMAKKPADRYQTPGDVAKALVPFFKPGQAPLPAKPRDEGDYPQYSMETVERPLSATPASVSGQPAPAFPQPVGLAPLSIAPIALSAAAPTSDREPEMSVSIDTRRPIAKRRTWWSSLLPWQQLSIAAGGAASVLLLGIVLLVRTPKGTVEIELSDRQADVTVTVDGNHIDIAGVDEPLSLDVGEHEYTVKGAGFKTRTKRFEVTRGKNAPLKITLLPPIGADDGSPHLADGIAASDESRLAAMLKAIKRPGQLGVVAEKLVIHNAHAGNYNNAGTLECNVKLFAGGRVVWAKRAVAVPWAANEDKSVTLPLPPERFERVRVEITKWEQRAGGLAEIQVFDTTGQNLALGCPAFASSILNDRNGGEHVTDGVTTTAEAGVGAWQLPRSVGGWVEVDLSLPRPKKLDGVMADKLVIWNQHNGPHNNHGTLECAVRLDWQGGEVWKRTKVAVPWAPAEDRSVSIELPPKRFDRVRVEIDKWQGQSGGLAELQILTANGDNLALECPAVATGIADYARDGRRVTDGILSSALDCVGYWLLPVQRRGWVEIDLACLDTEYGAACRKLGLAIAIVDGDWQRGLLWLARGDNPALRRLASADSLADSHFAHAGADNLALGDAWWELAEHADGAVKKRLLARSMLRYRQALDKLSGFQNTEFHARIDQTLPGLEERHFLFFIPEMERTLLGDSFRAPVSVDGVRSSYGIWLHPRSNKSSHVAYQIGKRFRRFYGAAAMNDSAGGEAATALTFRIVGDGRELWKSRPLQAAGSSHPFDVDISGVDKLELSVDCPGADRSCHAVWVDPRLGTEPARLDHASVRSDGNRGETAGNAEATSSNTYESKEVADLVAAFKGSNGEAILAASNLLGGKLRGDSDGAVELARQFLARSDVFVADDEATRFLHSAAKNKPISAAKLLLQIARARSKLRSYKAGHVVVGQVVVSDGKTDADLVLAQMPILEDGYFAGEVGDLKRPICFRAQGYQQLDIPLAGKKGDVVSVGEVRMEPLQKDEQASLRGTVELDECTSLAAAKVEIRLQVGTPNTPHNGYSPRGRWPVPVVATVAADGRFAADGLSPGAYYVQVKADKYTDLARNISLKSGDDLDLGACRLRGDIGKYIGKPAPQSKELAWEQDVPAAIERSKDERRPLMIMMTADWCVYCKMLENQTFSDPWVRQFLSPFVLVKAHEDKQVEGKYGLKGYPTLVFADSEGNQAYKSAGFKPVLPFCAEVARAIDALKLSMPPELTKLIDMKVIELTPVTITASGDKAPVKPVSVRANAAAASPAPATPTAGFIPLLKDRDLKGWLFAKRPGGRKFDEGAILLAGNNDYLITRRNNFKDFTLRMEMSASKGTEAMLAVRQQGTPAAATAITSRIFDNGTVILAGMQWLNFAPTDETGTKRAAVPYDQFFTLELRIKGNSATVSIDGVATSTNINHPGGKPVGALGIVLKKGNLAIRKVEIKESP